MVNFTPYSPLNTLVIWTDSLDIISIPSCLSHFSSFQRTGINLRKDCFKVWKRALRIIFLTFSNHKGYSVGRAFHAKFSCSVSHPFPLMLLHLFVKLTAPQGGASWTLTNRSPPSPPALSTFDNASSYWPTNSSEGNIIHTPFVPEEDFETVSVAWHN